MTRCGRCHGDNQPHMRFCVHCGNSLQGAGAESAQPSAPSAPVGSPAAGPAPTPFVQSAVQPPPAAQPAPAQPAPAQPAPSPVAPGGPTPHAGADRTVASLPQGAAEPGRTCSGCQRVGDGGAFCKFCGAPYDGPGGIADDGPATNNTAANSPVSASLGAARLVSIRKDGSDGQTFTLQGEHSDIGRTEGEIVLPEDAYLSPRHARISRNGDGFILKDLASVNGIYLRLTEAVELRDGDRILVGQQVLRLELLDDSELSLGPARTKGVLAFGTPEVPRFARLVQYTTEGVGRDVHYLYRDETVLGRETGDIVFTDDPFLSRRHAVLVADRGTKRVTLRDLGSANGTSVRLRGERQIRNGQQFRLGRHLFRFDAGGPA
ncbi:MAG: pSer/pThr/pTyr-binding forkhead associated (FHA) protein [Polyangiales bacterium]|jgi:pSer/pThr/pTyr-binding forkhead associated (FHA) protein